MMYEDGPGFKMDEDIASTPDEGYRQDMPLGDKGIFASVAPVLSASERSWAIFITRAYIGDDAACGERLMREFLAVLAADDTPPAALIFVNGGVKLLCVDSPALESIAALKARGSQILACRVSAEYHQLGLRLCGGAKAGMYEILRWLRSAHKVITV